MEFVPKAKFITEYQAWKTETQFSSTGDCFDNIHYRNIIDMGKGIVPYIHEIIKNNPEPIAYALEELLADEVQVKVDGFMKLDAYCKMWDMIIDSMWEKV